MSTFYDTRNPIPSNDPRDLDDNAKHIDAFANSANATEPDRFGVPRKTINAIINDSDSALLRTQLAADDGAERVGAGIRTQASKNSDVISVRDYITTAIDGTTSNQVGIQAAVNDCLAKNGELYWPNGTYVSTENILNFHLIRHTGPGVLVRGGSTWAITPNRTTLRVLYVSPAGSALNDGLTSALPINSIQSTIDIVHKWGPVIGRQQIIGAGGTYAEAISVPNGLCQENNYLEFKFPALPGVRTEPADWPVGAAIIDWTGLNPLIGFNSGKWNNIYIEYALMKGSFNSSLAATSQVSRGLSVDKFSFVFTYGCSYVDNGLSNLNLLPEGSASVTGGVLKNARYCVDNTGGSLSFTAVESTHTKINGGLEYGLHQKHASRTVLDYTEISDCGNVAGAANYGAGIFAYKANASVDTRGCKFYRNRHDYTVRGGTIASNPGIPDVYGTGVDASFRNKLIIGFATDDLINVNAQGGRDITEGFGGGTVTGATALALDTNTSIDKGYFVGANQRLRIEIYAANGAGGTAQIRPSLVTLTGTRYELGNFQIAAATSAAIELDVFTSSNGTIGSVYYKNIGATLGGTVTGQIIVNPLPSATEKLELQIWGDTSSTNVLTVRKSMLHLWG